MLTGGSSFKHNFREPSNLNPHQRDGEIMKSFMSKALLILTYFTAGLCSSQQQLTLELTSYFHVKPPLIIQYGEVQQKLQVTRGNFPSPSF